MVSSLRVLMLNHEFPPLGGGAARATYHIGRELAKAGHSVTVITTKFGDLPACETLNGVDIHRIYGRRRSLLDNNIPITTASYLVFGTRLALGLFRQQPFDIIHAFFTIPAGWVGVRLRQLTDVPLVISLRGSDVPYHNPGKFSGVVQLLIPLFAHIWRHASSVVALSNGLRHTAERTARDVSFRIIYNGVDTDLFEVKCSARAGGVPRLVTVSRLVRCKGIQYLLPALARLRNQGLQFQLDLVGDGNYRADLEKQCARLGLCDQVRFWGFVPHEQLPDHYALADLFVLPSLTESFGQAFAEAMACGLPVIGTTVGGIPEVVSAEQAEWLVPPGDADALTGKLSAALQSLETCQQMGLRNATYIRQRFSWAQVAGEYAMLYADLVQ